MQRIFLLHNLLDQASPENNPVASKVTLLEVLDRAAGQVGSSFREQPEVEAEIRLAMGGTYHQLGAYSKSESHYRAALGILQQDESNVARSTSARCPSWAMLSRISVGWTRRSRCSRRQPRTPANRWAPLDHITLSSTGHLANCYAARNRSADAERAVPIARQRLPACLGPKHPETLAAMNNLGVFLEGQQKFDEAERLFRECLALEPRSTRTASSRDAHGPL